MSLLRLPPELLQDICRQCDCTTEIPNLRLTSRDLRAAADEFLIQGHSIFYHKGHIERLEQIAAIRYGLRKGINRFTFDVRRLAAFQSFDDWFDDRYTSFKKWSESTEWTATRNEKEEEMPADIWRLKPWYDENIWIQWHPNKSLALSQARYQTYSELLDYQVQLERDSNLRRKLSNFFRACPTISSLNFTTNRLGRYRHHDETYRSGLVIPWRDETDVTLQLQETILAAHDGGLKIKELILFKLIRRISDMDLHWLQMPEVHKVLRHVEEFSSEEDHYYGVLPSTLRNGRIAQLLGHCASLRRLLLKGSNDFSRFKSIALVEAPLQLCHIVGNHTWTQLKSLSLFSFQFTSHELANLMLRHSQTLETLILDDLCVTDEDWPTCFSMFAGKLPRLKSVTLRNFFKRDILEEYWFVEVTDTDEDEEDPPDDPKVFEQWLINGGDGPPYLPGHGPNMRIWDLSNHSQTPDTSSQSPQSHDQQQNTQRIPHPRIHPSHLAGS